MAAEDLPPVTFGVKVTRDDGPGGHVHFDVFAGTNPDARGRAGSLVMREDEFHEFLRRLNPERLSQELRCCDSPNMVWECSRDGKDYFRCRACCGGMTKVRATAEWAVRDGG